MAAGSSLPKVNRPERESKRLSACMWFLWVVEVIAFDVLYQLMQLFRCSVPTDAASLLQTTLAYVNHPWDLPADECHQYGSYQNS